MSQPVQLEEGIAELKEEHGDVTNSGSEEHRWHFIVRTVRRIGFIKFCRRILIPAVRLGLETVTPVDNRVIRVLIYIYIFIVYLLALVICCISLPLWPLIWFAFKLTRSEEPFAKQSFLLLCVIAIVLDPLFFYIPVIVDDKKCIEGDQNLGITAAVLRSVFDILKIIYIIPALRIDLQKNVRKRLRLWLFFFIDIVVVLPIPQVLVFAARIRGTKFLFAMAFFLLQYLLRVIRTYDLFTQATGVLGILAEAKWAIVAFNLLLYMHGGHVFGSLWYFYAIEKVTACWKKACDINQAAGCSHSSFHCDGSSGDYEFLNNFCAIKTGNTSNYDFGLFNDALQSGIVEVTNFPKKFLHCSQWGLQNLSAFGSNLQTSADVWENIFAICMTMFGVVLFVFLIGKMQFDTERSAKIKLKWQEIRQWPHSKTLSKDVQGKIRTYKRLNWQETQRIDVDNLVHDLPKDLGTKVKQEIGLKLLKKVKAFKELSHKSLVDLCDCLKPVYFTERTRIIREGDPIDEMLFVLTGELWTYTSMNATATVSQLIDRRHRRENHLEDGDFCGEELVAWAQGERPSNLPRSNRTVQALTDVEAFALMADDLQHVLVLSHYDRAALLIQASWRFKRILRCTRNGQTISHEQKSFLRSLLDKLPLPFVAQD